MESLERIVSMGELRRSTGERGTRMYVAYQGLVYDVTDCPRWKSGLHENLHFPGQDLTGEMRQSSHMEEVFRRPCVKMIGRIDVDLQPAQELDEKEQVLVIEAVPVPGQEIETVCHRSIAGDPTYYPQAEFHGRTIYFCTETCQSVFLSDPERFYAAHSKRRP